MRWLKGSDAMTWLKRTVFKLVLLVLFLLLFVLATENSSLVSLQLISLKSPELPLSWWLVGTFLVGLVLGNVWSSVAHWWLRRGR